MHSDVSQIFIGQTSVKLATSNGLLHLIYAPPLLEQSNLSEEGQGQKYRNSKGKRAKINGILQC